MNTVISAGAKLRAALTAEKPLQITGAINAYCAIMAEKAGFKAVYVSGAGVANASFGVPDTGITTLSNVIEDVRRVTAACSLPVLVDVDTGFGDVLRIVKEMTAVGAAAVHIEDQVLDKRCGHLEDKQLVGTEEMVNRIKAAINAKTDPDFIIMARTDALASEGLSGALSRTKAYVEAGVDMIFAEAVTDLDQYRAFVEAAKVPVLANITEFGKTPMFTLEELKSAGVSIALYPLSAFRAMSAAAWNVYNTVRKTGSQKDILDTMQTRAQLYEFLKYDEITGEGKKKID